MTAVLSAASPPRMAYGYPAFALPCHPSDAATYGPAPITAQTQRPAVTAPSPLRALILAAMRQRRAQLIRRAKEAKAQGKRKAHSIFEAEIAGLTNALMIIEAGQ